MRLTCPECGAMASAASWKNDADVREFMARLIELPNPIQTRALPYLSLFRQGGRGLTWIRARRLLNDLTELVKSGRVQIRGEEERPAPIAAWAEAMEITIESRPKALTNHNYLRKIVWEKAAGLAANEEEKREKKRRESWTHKRKEEPVPVSQEELEATFNKLGLEFPPRHFDVHEPGENQKAYEEYKKNRPHPNPLPEGASPEGEGDIAGTRSVPLQNRGEDES